MKTILLVSLILTTLNINLWSMSPEEHQAVVSKYKFIRTDSKIISPYAIEAGKKPLKVFFEKNPVEKHKSANGSTLYLQDIKINISDDDSNLGSDYGYYGTSAFDQDAKVVSCLSKRKSKIVAIIFSSSYTNQTKREGIDYVPVIIELSAKDDSGVRHNFTKYFLINGHSDTTFTYNLEHAYPYYNEKAILNRLYEVGICVAPSDSKPLPETLVKEKYTKSQFNSSEYFNLAFKETPINVSSVVSYNNLAYNLEQSHDYNTSAYLLEKIIEKFPDRTVAYLNLGDAYHGLGDKEKATKAYLIYIDQMKKKGWEKKIPKRVLDQVGVNN